MTGFLIGPHDRPMLNEPTGRTHCYGIVTTPIGSRAVFGAEPVDLRGRLVNLADVWPLAERLRTALLEVPNGACGLDLLRRTLECLRVPAELSVKRAESVVRQLTRDPVESIADMAARLGISHGYLDRRHTGVAPSAYVRAQRATYSAVELASAAGFLPEP